MGSHPKRGAGDAAAMHPLSQRGNLGGVPAGKRPRSVAVRPDVTGDDGEAGAGMKFDLLAVGPLTGRTVHLCIDMQNLFAEDTPWRTPCMDRVLRAVQRLAERHPARTVFTRFIPPYRAEDLPGT